MMRQLLRLIVKGSGSLLALSSAAIAAPDPDRTDDPLWSEARSAIESRDYEKAAPPLKMLAANGSRRAQTFLGNIYAMGLGSNGPDFVTARRWWLEAAQRGYSQAQYNLGASYLNGDGGSTDRPSGIHWLREAADRGNGQAMIYVGEALLTDEDRTKHPDGYAYLRMAQIREGLRAQVALGRALTGAYSRDSVELFALRSEAVSRLWTSTLVDPANPLGQQRAASVRSVARGLVPGPSADRDEDLAYQIDLLLRGIFGMQDRVGHPTDRDKTLRTPDSFVDVVEINSRAFANAGRRSGGRPLILYTFFVAGTSAGTPVAAYLPAEVLWSIARPGDQVFISDLFSHHMTTIYQVEQALGKVSFADVWPDDFMLREGRNLVDARASIEMAGATRRLVVAKREDFTATVKGLATIADEDFPKVMLEAFPDLARDWRIQLSFGVALLRAEACATSRAALGHLIEAYSLAETSGKQPAVAKQVIADRVTMARAHIGICAVATELTVPEATLARIGEGTLQTLTRSELQTLFGALLQAGGAGRAKDLADRIAAADREAPDGYVMRALVELKSGQPEQAKALFSQAIDRLEPLLATEFDRNKAGLVEKVTRERRQGLLELSYLERARLNLAKNPTAAYNDAQRSIALNPTSEALRLGIDAARASGKTDRLKEFEEALGEHAGQGMLELLLGPSNR
jgi:hypothetical protein